MSTTTTRVVWKDYVEVGLPKPDNFIVEEVARPQVTHDGELLLELLYLSVDPYMRGRMKNTPGYFVGPFQPGEPLQSSVLARVIESRNHTIPAGTVVQGFLPWQQVQLVTKEAAAHLQVASEQVAKDVGAPLSVWMGALGMTGMTAFCSLERIGKPKAGETVFVSGAAGAVGLIVGQLCKNVYGCRVVGSAGSDDKVAFLLQHGFDGVWNYKKVSTDDGLKQHAPNGIDVYFDNVGGETLETALKHAKLHARVVACGSISQYNSAAEDQYGVKNLFLVVTRRITFQGFIVADFNDMQAEFIEKMTGFLKSGKVKHVEHLVEGGLPAAGQAFIDLMGGANIGKVVVKCC